MSDPESVLERIEQAKESFGDLVSLVQSLSGSRTRLEALETQLDEALSRSAGVEDSAKATIADAQREIRQLRESGEHIRHEIQTERERHTEQLRAALIGIQGDVEELVSRSNKATAEAIAARTELFADYERFRQEELNKLNDLSASYNLLRDRVHETELATARRVDQIAQDTRSAVDASRVEIGSLGARLDDSLEALATEVRAELSAQAAESAAIRTSTSELVSAAERRARRLLFLFVLPTWMVLAGIAALLLR